MRLTNLEAALQQHIPADRASRKSDAERALHLVRRMAFMPQFRLAREEDVPALLPMLQDFYLFERLPFDAERSERLLREVIANENFGRIILFESEGQLAGYMALTFGYSLEFHGRDALIDEFYVRPELRYHGIGEAALQYALKLCKLLGISAVHLEADHFNPRVHEFYKRHGFRDHERHLMTRWLE